MKRTFLIFCLMTFSLLNRANSAYFYADAVDAAIQDSFPADLQSTVAAEYEAQMDQNGEIDTDGFEQVCYAGGYDVSTLNGAENCAAFANKITETCVYATGKGLPYYTNPTTPEEKIRKCVFDKAIDYVLVWDGRTVDRRKEDKGNRICDKYGNPLTDDKGNELLGVSKFGITTCASGLSVHCVENMTENQARQYYWTRFYRKYGYYKLPVEALAAVMELAVGGTGTVASELRATANITGCGTGSVINDCMAEAVKRFIDENGVDAFYKTITTMRADKRGARSKARALGVQELSNAHIICQASVGD